LYVTWTELILETEAGSSRIAPCSAEIKECVELYLHSRIRLHGVVLSYIKKSTGTTLTLRFLMKIRMNREAAGVCVG